MKFQAVVTLWVVGVLGVPGGEAASQTFWTGPAVSFVKPDFADWTLAENQDRMTERVWLTRQDQRGIFNLAQEAEFDGVGQEGFSPVDTEWAFGTLAEDVVALSYQPWNAWAAGNPPGLVGRDVVVHLITEDIYLGLRFTSWTSGANGGGFAYQRTSPVPEPATLAVLALGLAGLWRRRPVAR